jgi:hypothetical protein
MRVAIYARVSTESQEARGTIGSQLEVLRKRVATGHDLVANTAMTGADGRGWPPRLMPSGLCRGPPQTPALILTA